jgi:hypothetical protein
MAALDYVKSNGTQLVGVIAVPAGIELIHGIAHPAFVYGKPQFASPDDLVYLAVSLQLHEVADVVTVKGVHEAKKKPRLVRLRLFINPYISSSYLYLTIEASIPHE